MEQIKSFLENNFVKAFLVVLSIFFIAFSYKLFEEARDIVSSNKEETKFTVVGEHTITSIPEVASFTITLSSTEKTSKQAQEKVKKQNKELMQILSDFGIDKKDIKTLSFNTYPEYEWVPVCKNFDDFNCPTKKEKKGYRVSQTIKVKVKDIDKAGELIDKISQINPESVSSLNFEVEAQKGLEEKAKLLAIKDAKEKAQKIADTLGVKIVGISDISFNNYYPKPMYMKAVRSASLEGAGGGEFSLPAGENEIKATVRITFIFR